MKCPGQDSQFWKPGAIYEVKCPQCGSPVEFFKDDTQRTCRRCGHRFLNPHMDFGCAAYCPYAEQCIGNLPPELLAQKEDLLKDRVAVEVKRHFRKDFRKVSHAIRVARYAEQLGKAEQGNLGVILIASYLKDVGANEVEGQDGDAESVSREILSRLEAPDDLVEAVVDIVSRRQPPREDDTVEYRCVYDADQIAALEEELEKSPVPEDEIKRRVDERIVTESGRNLAVKQLSKLAAG